ncbi:TPA: hypothetical protein N0F65_003741 [Lagenidium giganteum]|uniref:Protein kinase domain-containing protein n=1 Tax=Lagenidium giganteum TaxID=4803 RepID=A0AAV2YQU5_9STRA|nr:TPA: hypothetical protein N0F65_003741 [Lagenidium giganteum]
MADVLTRCKTLLPTETTTLVTMSASDVPSDVRAALSKKGAKWESMTDAGRVGVLWSYGYVFYGSLDSSAKYSQVAKVYTECSSAGGSDTEVSGGVAMSDIALSSAKYTSAGCTASTSSSLTSSQMLDSFPSMNGCKTIKEYCAESTILNDFVHDQDILTRKIAHEEVTFLRLLSKGAFVAEYMESGDLSDVFARSKGKLSWSKEKISIAMDIADGLVYLHTLQPKVIHRDLKSKNVLLNKKYQAKLSDFGVSRKSNVNETLTSGVGTLLWTAPEIIEGKKYDEKADIYSFGVVLSEIDTCQGPFAHMKTDKGDNIPGMQLVQMVRLGQLRVSFSDDCPAAIRELAEACTQLDPDFRPTSMEAAFTLKSKIAPKLRNALQRIDSA